MKPTETTKRKIIRGIEPDPRLDAVLGAGARGNYYRSNSIYRALIIEFTDGYSNILATDWAAKRSFVGVNVIEPILRRGGRFLVIEKDESAREARSRGLSKSQVSSLGAGNHGTCYYQLNLDNITDRKMAVKAIQQAMRDEMKARARKRAKERQAEAQKESIFADAPEDGSSQIAATVRANYFPGSNHNLGGSDYSDGMRKRSTKTPTKRKSTGLVLPTRRRNLLPLNRRTGNSNSNNGNGSGNSTEEEEDYTQSPVPPPASHIPSSLQANLAMHNSMGIQTVLNPSMMAYQNNHTPLSNNDVAPSMPQSSLQQQKQGNTAMVAKQNGMCPMAANNSSSSNNHLDAVGSQQQTALLVQQRMAMAKQQSMFLSQLTQQQQQHYFANKNMMGNNTINPQQQPPIGMNNNSNNVHHQDTNSMMASSLQQQQHMHQQLQLQQKLLQQQQQMQQQQLQKQHQQLERQQQQLLQQNAATAKGQTKDPRASTVDNSSSSGDQGKFFVSSYRRLPLLYGGASLISCTIGFHQFTHPLLTHAPLLFSYSRQRQKKSPLALLLLLLPTAATKTTTLLLLLRKIPRRRRRRRRKKKKSTCFCRNDFWGGNCSPSGDGKEREKPS